MGTSLLPPSKINTLLFDKFCLHSCHIFLTSIGIAFCFNSAKDSLLSANFPNSSLSCWVSSLRVHFNFDTTRFGCCTAPDSNFCTWETLLVWSFLNCSNARKTFFNLENACCCYLLRKKYELKRLLQNRQLC